MDYLENRTFDEIALGDSATIERTLTHEDIELFAVMSGDVNPAHLDEEYANSEMFHKVIAHGMWGGALISAVLGTSLPGPGTIYIGQTLLFRRPVGIGDTVTVTAASKDADKKSVVFDCLCVNQDGKPVIDGTASVLAPTEKVRRPRLDRTCAAGRAAALRHGDLAQHRAAQGRRFRGLRCRRYRRLPAPGGQPHAGQEIGVAGPRPNGAAHVILGARVPILMPSQVDETLPRRASFALAAMMTVPPTGKTG